MQPRGWRRDNTDSWRRRWRASGWESGCQGQTGAPWASPPQQTQWSGRVDPEGAPTSPPLFHLYSRLYSISTPVFILLTRLYSRLYSISTPVSTPSLLLSLLLSLISNPSLLPSPPQSVPVSTPFSHRCSGRWFCSLGSKIEVF